MERSDRLWIEGKFVCCDCQEEIDDSRKVVNVFGDDICEICAVKCSICENQFFANDIFVVNGDNVCISCRGYLFVIYDTLHNVYLVDYICGSSNWCADKSEVMLFDSRIEAQEIIAVSFSNNERYQIQKL